MSVMQLESMKWAALLAVGLLGVRASGDEAAVLKTPKERESYAIGADLARNLNRQGVQVEVEVLLEGMRDVLSGGKVLMTEDELRETLRAFQVELRRRQFPNRMATGDMAEQNSEKGAAFLAENKTKPGVVTLASGVQYKILRAGNGRKPTEADTVECHHRGTHLDGREFNSSERAGKPATLKVCGIVTGLKEAMLLMPVGSKWEIYVPPPLAYGERGTTPNRGAGPNIGPNETLVFEVELLAIK